MKTCNRLSIAVVAIILLLSCETQQQKAEKARQAEVALQQARDAENKDRQRKEEEAVRRAAEAEAARIKKMLGDELLCSVNTAGKEYLNVPVNKSIENLRGFLNRETGTLTITFDFNSKAMRIYAPFCCRLLVRLFDRNGEYQEHFISKERFIQPGAQFSQTLREQAVLSELSSTGNTLQYQINLRDAAFVSAMEVGWNGSDYR